VIVQVPGVRSVITPDEVTVQMLNVDEVYVGATPEVAVAAGTGGVAPIAVFASAGKVIVFVPAPMLIVTVCGVAVP
jgi:hypothetical protein